ncbi:hypothetical protein Tco_0218367 [Tanacetum coccineum]
MESVKKSTNKRAQHKREYNSRMNERQMQSKQGKVDSSKALDASLVVTESSGTESNKQDTSSRSWNNTDALDADIRLVSNEEPRAEVQLTAEHNVLANEQQHTVKSKPIYDTYMLEKVDSNTTPDSTNMCNRGGEIVQNAKKCQVTSPLLDPSFDNMSTEFSNQSLKSENISLKKTVAQLQKVFSRIKAHCVNMELKYQNQALKDGQHGQILNETSNKAKIKKEIEVLETIKLRIIGTLSPNKSFAMHEKPYTPRSCLRWKPTGRIFKTASLRWIPTGKMFIDSPTKVDSEPLNGSNDDITNPYECDQTLNVSADWYLRSHGFKEFKSDDHEQWRLLATLQAPLLKEKKGYFKPPPNVDHPVPEVPAPVPAASTSLPSSTTVDQDAPSTNDFHDIEVAYMDNDPYFGIPIPEPSSDETTLQGVIPSNLHHPNQSFDTLTKLTKNHPLKNVISDPSRPFLTRSQLQEHVIWCYFDANDNPIPFGRKRSG